MVVELLEWKACTLSFRNVCKHGTSVLGSEAFSSFISSGAVK